ALASAMIVRSRGFMSGSPPPARAATVNSLMRRVKIFPRLASAAPFLCLMECHLEWPDISKTPKESTNSGTKSYHRAGRFTRASGGRPAKLHAVRVLAPSGNIGDEVDAENAAMREDTGDRSQRPGQVAVIEKRLQQAVWRKRHRERPVCEGQRPDVGPDKPQR